MKNNLNTVISASVLTGLIISAGLPGVVAAQESLSVLPEVQVTASAEDASVTEGSNEYTIEGMAIGSKSVQSLRNTPQSVSVITQQRIQDQNLKSMDAALAQSTGITVNNTLNRSSSLFARGFLVDMAQLDGVPIALPTNNYGFNSPDLSIYDHIEVLRGSAGLLNGAGTPGAVIGLTRKRATKHKQFQASASIGSWSNKRLELDAGGPLNADGTLRARAILMKEDRDFYYDVAKQNRTLLYGVVDYDLTARTRLSLGLSHQDISGIPVSGTNLPRYSNGADLRLPRSSFLGAAWNREEVRDSELFAEMEHRFDADWQLKASAVHTRAKNDSKISFLLGSINPETGAGAFQRGDSVDSEVKRTGFDAFLSGGFQSFGYRQEVVLGANFSEHSNAYDIVNLYQTPYTPVDIFAHNPYTVPEPTTPPSSSGGWKQRTSQNGIYGTLRWRLSDSSTLVMGTRSSHWHFRQHNLRTGIASSDYSDSAITPFAGLIHDLTPQWSAYASYSDIFTVQNAFDIDGKRLDPITGTNYEIGLKGELLEGKLNTSLALFHITRKNVAERDTVNTGPTDCNSSYCYVPGGKTQSQGIEAEVNGRIQPGWNLFAGYTYNTTKYVRNRTATGEPSANEGQPLAAWVPKHIFRVWSSYQLPGELDQWTVGAGANIQSKFYRNLNGNLMEQRGLSVWNAHLRYQLDANWSASLNVNNIFDKRYYGRFNLLDQGSSYGEPRNFTFTVRGKF